MYLQSATAPGRRNTEYRHIANAFPLTATAPVFMRIHLLPLVILLFCLLSKLYGQQTPKHWKEISLPEGWTFYAPDSFAVKKLQGVDSQVGRVHSSSDSISIEYDIGRNMNILFAKPDCSLKAQIARAKGILEDKSTKELYQIPEVNRGYVDTINGIVVRMIVPQKVGNGIIHLSAEDCKTRDWMGLSVKVSNADSQELILKIFNTLTFKAKSR